MFNLFGSLTSLAAALVCGLVGLLFVCILSRKILKMDAGSEVMVKISNSIHRGAMAFLYREYKVIAFFILAIAIILFFVVARKMALAFLVGAFFSILAGYFGMQVATRANTRTAQGAEKSVNAALAVAFPGGAVMGLSVVSLGLLGLSLVFLLFIGTNDGIVLSTRIMEATSLIVGFSMGASLVALFARVGGGIYTKAADVGADLVGKVEQGIPEDDHRNPAVIADNVGDNVGDVAGMGADLYESYVGVIIACLTIAAASFNTKGMMLALLLAGWGILSSIVGVFFVRIKEGQDPQKALRNGMIASALVLIIGAFILTTYWYNGSWKIVNTFFSVLSGLFVGFIVGFTAEYFTSGREVRRIAQATTTGPATNIIYGLAVGMKSTVYPIVAIALATLVAYWLQGIFGVALSALGMLSITGMIVAVDAYGPIADNAAGIAEMAGMKPKVRQRAERLDAVGNTTAALGKGFAIGSAALTALALFVAYSQTVGLELINCLQAKVVAGLFIGGIVPFLFCSFTMQAVGRTAHKVVEEVRRQFREIKGLMEGKVMPDSYRCVDITTRGALKEMIAPGVIAVVIPFVIGIALGAEALGGFLVGSLVTGVPLALMLANAGGAWDNAKKYIEEGNLGGKGSQIHKDSVIGDTVGDPFKDTAGPSLNILLKLMAIIALVFSGVIISLHEQLLSLVDKIF
jgi:K(+)-stimulated pyrophosphate-energized sodium pump